MLTSPPERATNKHDTIKYWTVSHCVVTEKAPASYRSLKMADTSIGKCSILVDWGGITWTKQCLSVHRGRKVHINVSEYWYNRGKSWKGCMRCKKENSTVNCLLTGWERHLYVKEKVLANKERYVAIDPWYGPRTIRTIEFRSHTVAFKSSETFYLLLPAICNHY